MIEIPQTLIQVKDIMTDLMGYTGQNSLNKKFYKTNTCLVHRDLIPSLNKIQSDLKLKGLQLCIIDAYRPLSVQTEIFNIIGDTKYVSDPKCSRHPRGTSIDVTLCDLRGNRLEMPTDFSAFGEKCWANTTCDNPNALINRTLLQEVMTSNGFQIYPYEWWHFDYKGWCDDDKYPALDFAI